MQVESSKFTQNPGTHVICVNGTQPKQAQVLIRECNVSNNPGVYGRTCSPSGAISCTNSTSLIDHCTINGNTAMMTEPGLCGTNAGLYIVDSNVMLKDTLIEENTAFSMTAMGIFDSNVTMSRCSIRANWARSIFYISEYRGGKRASICINSGSEVSMNDVIIEGNIADDDYGAIENAGKLNLNEGTVIARNTARRYSGLYSPESGVVNINKNAHIYDNVDKQQPPQSIHSEGILNMGVN